MPGRASLFRVPDLVAYVAVNVWQTDLSELTLVC
jgi:hypothetical protein